MTPPPVTVGAVAYHPRVAGIWAVFERWFGDRGAPIAPTLFRTYDDQLEALFDGRIEVAWNTNLAYVEAQRRAGGGCGMLAMRDNDRDWRTHAVVRGDSPVRVLHDLAAARIGFASSDSPQATILPIHFMRAEGFDPERDAHAERLEVDIGKHGDTGGAEHEQLARLVRGEVDAAILADATCAAAMPLDAADGVALRRVWTSPPYHHCNFTVLPDHDPDRTAAFRGGLLAMVPDEREVAEAMELEWVGRWVPGDEAGYGALYEAVGVRLGRTPSAPSRRP